MSETKLQRLIDTLTTDILSDSTLTEPRRVVSPSASSTSTSSSVVINPSNQSNESNTSDNISPKTHLKIQTSILEEDLTHTPEPPIPPPTHLIPGKHYALYPFHGTDPSHCEIVRDDTLELLNDQDGYWWLVRNERSEKIGFVPVDCLEDYGERLARLNCWKNEEAEKVENKKKFSAWGADVNNSEAYFNEVRIEKEGEGEIKEGKVRFSETVLNYDRVISDDEISLFDDSDEEFERRLIHGINKDYDSDDDINEFRSHRDPDHEGNGEEEEELEDGVDHEYRNEISSTSSSGSRPSSLSENIEPINHETNSEISTDFAPPPLTLSKNRNNTHQSSSKCHIPASPDSPQDSLNSTSTPIITHHPYFTSPLTAPNAYFYNNTNTSGSIGTYSPSSSEMESPGNTPPMTRKPPPSSISISETLCKEKVEGGIPSSKATRDIANYNNSMRMLDDLINDEENTNQSIAYSEDQDQRQNGNAADDTVTYPSEDDATDEAILIINPVKKDKKLGEPIHLKDRSNFSTSESLFLGNSSSELGLLNSSNTTIDLNTITASSSSSTANGILSHLEFMSTSSSNSIPTVSNVTTVDLDKSQSSILSHLSNKSMVSVISNDGLHPEVKDLFRDSMEKIDELAEKLREISEQLK